MNYNEQEDQRLSEGTDCGTPSHFTSPPPGGENAPLLSEDGSFSPEWYNRFEDLQGSARTLAKFKRPEALAKSYAALESLKGYPDPQDQPRMQAFRRSMGLPESADEFTLPRPEEAPEDAWDDALAQRLSKVAYEYGVPEAAMKALAGSYARECREQLQAYQAAQQEILEEVEAELQNEWGAQYENNLHAAQNALTRLAGSCGVDADEMLASPDLRMNANLIRILNEAAKLMDEAPMRRGSSANDSKEEAKRMLYDPSHPLHEAYMKTNHPQHKYANQLYDRLAFGK